MGQLIVFIHIVVPSLVATIAPALYERHGADVRPVYDAITRHLGPPGSTYHLATIAIFLLIIFKSPICKALRKTCWFVAIFVAPLFFNPELTGARQRRQFKRKFAQTTFKIRKIDPGQLLYARKILRHKENGRRLLVSRAKKMVLKFHVKDITTQDIIVGTKKMTKNTEERSAHARRKFVALSTVNKEIEKLVEYKDHVNTCSITTYTLLYEEMSKQFDRQQSFGGFYLSEVRNTFKRDLEYWDQTFKNMEERYQALLNMPEIRQALE